MDEFPAAPLDTTAKVVSACVAGTLVIAGGMVVAASPPVPSTLLSAGLAGIFGVTWAMAPSGYRIHGGDLVVERNRWAPFRSRIVGIAEVDDPRRMGLRVGGSGGAFGYFGRFRRRDIGIYRAYLTSRSRDHVIALQTADGIVTVSPADPAAMVRAISGAHA